jgi:uncharacterized protein (TIGR00299 family) protein
MTTMRIAYWDCFSGIAGDMNLGAMVGCGLSVDELRADLAGLALEGFSIEHRRVRRGALVADKIDVTIGDAASGATATFDHDRDSDFGGAGGRGAADGTHRTLADVREILATSTLPEGVAERAEAVFEALCAAEAAVHGTGVDEVHLHEVGGIDAFVDIVGACCGLRRLGIEALRCSPLNVGAGEADTAHGALPVPAPATAHLLRGAPVYARGPAAELVTPTGAALAAVLADGFGPWPDMTIEAVGYGAGDHDFDGRANVLRLVVGSAQAGDRAGGGATEDTGAGPGWIARVEVLEANLDDTNPQIVGALIPKLLDAGALDAFTTPAFMKKNRPGVQLTVLAPAEILDILSEMILRETTTLGVRRYPVMRRELDRRHVEVTTRWGPVRVKVGTLGVEDVNWAPEFDDCERLAAEAGVPVKHIIQAASAAYARDAATEEDES